MSKTLVLEDNIEGTNYNQLLDICFDLSTYFSFTKRHFHTKNSVYLKFLKDLAPSYIKTEFTWHWFSYNWKLYLIPKSKSFYQTKLFYWIDCFSFISCILIKCNFVLLMVILSDFPNPIHSLPPIIAPKVIR